MCVWLASGHRDRSFLQLMIFYLDALCGNSGSRIVNLKIFTKSEEASFICYGLCNKHPFTLARSSRSQSRFRMRPTVPRTLVLLSVYSPPAPIFSCMLYTIGVMTWVSEPQHLILDLVHVKTLMAILSYTDFSLLCYVLWLLMNGSRMRSRTY